MNHNDTSAARAHCGRWWIRTNRRPKPTGLQPVPFDRLGNLPGLSRRVDSNHQRGVSWPVRCLPYHWTTPRMRDAFNHSATPCRPAGRWDLNPRCPEHYYPGIPHRVPSGVRTRIPKLKASIPSRTLDDGDSRIILQNNRFDGRGIQPPPSIYAKMDGEYTWRLVATYRTSGEGWLRTNVSHSTNGRPTS